MGLNLAIGTNLRIQGLFDWVTYWLTRFPSLLTATSLSLTEIGLAWTNNGLQDYDGISIERSDDGITYGVIHLSLAGDTTYVDNTCVLNHYYYRIRYYRGARYSAYSNVAYNAVPLLVWDGNTVAWFKHDDSFSVIKDGANRVSFWLDRMNYSIGAEMVNQATWYTAAFWALQFDPNWSQVGNTLLSNGANGNLGKLNFFTIGKLYKITISVIVNAGQLNGPYDGTAPFTSLVATGTYTYYYLCDTGTTIYFVSALFDGSITALSIKEITGKHLIQQTAANQPLWSLANGVLFDGVNDFMKCIAFAYIQPEFIYFVGRQITYTLNDELFSGNVGSDGSLVQNAGSPNIRQYAGGFGVQNANLVINIFSIIRILFNGAASSLQVNETAAIVSNPGAANMNGFILGSRTTAVFFSNTEVKEIILRKSADNAATQTLIYNYLHDANGLP